MRKILISGAIRSGKSTLARMLAKELNISHIPLDPIVNAFGENFPKLNIRHEGLDHHVICRNLKPFLFTFLDHLGDKYTYSEKIDFIIESTHILPEDAVELKKQNFEVAFLGYPKKSIESKFKEIRKFETDFHWTKGVSDETLKRNIKEFTDLSKELEKDCEKFGLDFYDTGSDFQGTLDMILKKFKNE